MYISIYIYIYKVSIIYRRGSQNQAAVPLASGGRSQRSRAPSGGLGSGRRFNRGPGSSPKGSFEGDIDIDMNIDVNV